MPKPLSNPTTRVLQVLEYLATRPSEHYGLSDLSRSTKMSKSTCLAILNTLVEAGYVIQHPVQRYYSLGPAAIAVGQAALIRFPDVSDVLPVLKRLARETNMTATCEALAGDQLVVVASAGRGDLLSGIGRTGVRLPFSPPYGAAFGATIDLDTFRSYINRANPPLTDDEIRNLVRSFEIGRQRGYFIGLDLPEDHPLHSQLAEAWSARSPNRKIEALVAARRVAGYLLDEIDPDATYTVTAIQAPVVSRGNTVEIALALLAFGWPAKGEQLIAIANKLKTAAEAVAEGRAH